MRFQSGSITSITSSMAIGGLGTILLAAWFATFGTVAAQDATPPEGGSQGISCSLEQTGSMDGGGAMATPADEATAMASPAAEMVATPAGAEPTDGMIRTVRTIAICVNSGDFAGATALMTDNFIQNVIGVASAAEVETALAGADRMLIRLLLTPETYDDGTASVIVVFEGFTNTTGSVIAERWYFVVEDGVYKVDRVEATELPPGIS